MDIKKRILVLYMYLHKYKGVNNVRTGYLEQVRFQLHLEDYVAISAQKIGTITDPR